MLAASNMPAKTGLVAREQGVGTGQRQRAGRLSREWSEVNWVNTRQGG